MTPGEWIRGDRAVSRWGLAQPPSSEQAGSCSRLAVEPGPDAAAAAGWMPESLFPHGRHHREQRRGPSPVMSPPWWDSHVRPPRALRHGSVLKRG